MTYLGNREIVFIKRSIKLIEKVYADEAKYFIIGCHSCNLDLIQYMFVTMQNACTAETIFVQGTRPLLRFYIDKGQLAEDFLVEN